VSISTCTQFLHTTEEKNLHIENNEKKSTLERTLIFLRRKTCLLMVKSLGEQTLILETQFMPLNLLETRNFFSLIVARNAILEEAQECKTIILPFITALVLPWKHEQDFNPSFHDFIGSGPTWIAWAAHKSKNNDKNIGCIPHSMRISTKWRKKGYMGLMSIRLLWSWKAGVIQLPQLHCMPAQVKYPKRASQWAQDSFPSNAPSSTM